MGRLIRDQLSSTQHDAFDRQMTLQVDSLLRARGKNSRNPKRKLHL